MVIYPFFFYLNSFFQIECASISNKNHDFTNFHTFFSKLDNRGNNLLTQCVLIVRKKLSDSVAQELVHARNGKCIQTIY